MDINVALLIITIIAVAVAVCTSTLLYLKIRGVDKTPDVLKMTGGMLKGADAIAEILKLVLPSNVVVNVVDKIIDYALVGVKKAEQLYLTNEIGKEERKDEAIKFVSDALELAGIEKNETIENLIDGAIEAAVNTLEPTNKPPEDTDTAA